MMLAEDIPTPTYSFAFKGPFAKHCVAIEVDLLLNASILNMGYFSLS